MIVYSSCASEDIRSDLPFVMEISLKTWKMRFESCTKVSKATIYLPRRWVGGVTVGHGFQRLLQAREAAGRKWVLGEAGRKGSKRGERRLCSCLAGEEGCAVKIGVRIVDFELLDGPPRRSAVGDVAAETFWHDRVEDSELTTIASKDKRA